jgi:hypothetical protein
VTRVLLGVALTGVLGWYYCAGALEHARVVNTAKSRGDQSAYLYEAQILYKNWHGLNDPPVVQPRNRMPFYPAVLAAIYQPSWTDPEFFEAAKTASVYFSLLLLAAIAAVAFRRLPLLPATNFLLVVAFGYFIFKAGYAQAELLFYTLHLLTFVLCWQMFVETRTARRLGCAAAAGLLAALAYLTKAANLPFAALVAAIAGGQALITLARTRQLSTSLRVAAPALIFGAAFLVVLSPYIRTSKRIHGQYFYNLNTAALIWYDGYPEASVAILSYGPDGWPPGPPSGRPSAIAYLRGHSSSQIAARFGGGFRDMAAVLFRGYMIGVPLALYLAAAVGLVATRRHVAAGLIRRHRALGAFLVAYAGLYLPAIAFYEPTSGTGTARFLLAHAAPLLFAVTMLLAHRDVDRQQWRVGGALLSARHFHWLVAAVLIFSLLFVLPNRLVTTYGGF